MTVPTVAVTVSEVVLSALPGVPCRVAVPFPLLVKVRPANAEDTVADRVAEESVVVMV